MSDLVLNNRGLVKTEIIGKSTENRPLTVIHIGNVNDTSKPRIWIDAGIHAREWVSISTALYFIHMVS